jgi:hypothetical protein
MTLESIIQTMVVSAHGQAWPVFTGAVILLSVYMSKLPMFGAYWDKIPKPYRPGVVAVLGIVYGVAQALMMSQPITPFLVQGLVSALLAIGADQVITKPIKASSEVDNGPAS